MPYIKQDERQELLDDPKAVNEAGSLNFLITKALLERSYYEEKQQKIEELVDAYLTNTGRRYQTYNEVVGVLECARREWARRVGTGACAWILQEITNELYRKEIAPYEDRKIAENGDVY